MINPPARTQQIFKGQRIAQLILVPYYSLGQSVTDNPRGKKGCVVWPSGSRKYQITTPLEL